MSWAPVSVAATKDHSAATNPRPASAEDYLALKNVMCVGGSWLTPKSLVEAEDWNGIRQLAKEAAERFHH